MKKPWGGQLEAVREFPRESVRPEQFAGSALMLRKLCEMTLMTALVAVPMLYVFSLQGPRLTAWQNWFQEMGDGPYHFWREQILPFVGGIFPVLESKFSAWFIVGTLLFGAYTAARLFEALTGMEVFPRVPEEVKREERSLYRRIPLFAILAFLLWSFVSVLFWPPSMPPEAAALMNRTGLPPDLPFMDRLSRSVGGGGMLFSVVGWCQVAFALFFFLVAEDIMRTRLLINKIAGIIVLVGIVNAAMVIVQKMEFGWVESIWMRFGEDNTRNQLGAFIGHNTGVSSFLMAPFLILLTWIVSVQPKRRRLANVIFGSGIGILAIALVLAQSRAVIPILVVSVVILMVLLFTQSSLRTRGLSYVWLPVVILLVILTQLIPAKYNPLYREDVTLTERISEFRPGHLRTETRFRIAAVSLTELIPERPFVGHGFGSFQYVYPKAQGVYYEDFPRSPLQPTAKRTMRAHNEYLQTLVETGLIGLGIVLVGLWFLLRGGWMVLQRTLMPHHIAMQASILVSIVAILLHGLTDFPLRIPPIAVLLIVLLAIWSAGHRLWVFPIREPRPEPEITDEIAESRGNRHGLRWKIGGMRVAVVVWLMLAGCIATAIPLLNAATISRFQTWKSLESLTTQLILQMVQNPSSASTMETLGNTIRGLKKIAWTSGPAHFYASQASYNSAIIAFRDADELARQERFTTASKVRAMGVANGLQAIHDINQAFAEERYHSMYRSRSDVYFLLAGNQSGEDRENYRTNAIDDLARAANMNPGDPEVLYDLIEQLRPRLVFNRSEIVRLMGLLAWYHPEFFEARIYTRVANALALEEVIEANEWMSMVYEAAPKRDEYEISYALTLLRTGRTNEAMAIASRFLEADPSEDDGEVAYQREVASMIRIYAALLRENYGFALQALEGAERFEYVPRELVLSLKYFSLLRSAQRDREPEGIEELRADLLRMGRQNEQIYQVVGMSAFTWFNNTEATIDWLERRAAVPSPAPPMDLQGRVVLAKAYAHNADWEGVARQLPFIREQADRTYIGGLARIIARALGRQAEQATDKTEEELRGEPVTEANRGD